MATKWITWLAGVIATVVLISITIVLVSPDGAVDDRDGTSPSVTTSSPTASPTPTRTKPRLTADRAPASVRGTWPGRPKKAKLKGTRVDWCPAVRTIGAGEAIGVFGRAAVREAACDAVSFVFDERYSRLALPRRSYAPRDFDGALRALAPATAGVYRSRIHQFLADPDSRSARRGLGLVLFRGEGTSGRAEHAAAGKGRVFYGPAFTTKGYRGRATWVNPTWSKVRIRVDRSKATPRIVATLNASASMPVFHRAKRRPDMLTVPTRASFFMRPTANGWKIGGIDVTREGPLTFSRLEIR